MKPAVQAYAEIEKLLTEVRARKARQSEQEQSRETIRKTIAAAREFASRREWEKALGVINAALTMRPDCAEYIEETRNIQQLRLRDWELTAVERALAGGDLHQAINMAEAALANYPGEPRAVAALQSARNLRELSDLVLYARRRLMNGDIDEARQLVFDGRRRFPESTQLLEIETEIDQAGAFENSVRSVRTALKEHRFDDARTTAQPLLATSPANRVLRELLAEIKTQQDEYERQQAYDRGRAEADRLARAFDFPAAIEKIEQLLGDFPGDPALDADRKAIQAARLLREERIRTDALINELETLFRNGDAEAVRQGAKQLDLNRNEPRVAELLDWAEKSIAQTREIRRNGRRRGPLLLAIGLGIAAVVVVVAAIVGLPASPSPITVQPEELAFSYTRGGNVPKPLAFQIKAGRRDQKWTATSVAPWLRFSKTDGTGTSDVEASVDPSGLSPGQYESVATVGSAAAHKMLIVRLHVTEPPVTTPQPAPPLATQEVQIVPSQLDSRMQEKDRHHRHSEFGSSQYQPVRAGPQRGKATGCFPCGTQALQMSR